MWTSAFDASGKAEDQDFVVVAGFVAQAKLWIEFDRAWRARLAEDHLARFHMSDWFHGKGLFGDRAYWTLDRRQRILDDLVDIIQWHASAKFACAIINKSFTTSISPANRQQFLLNSYVLAARAVIELANEWSLYRDNSPFAHVFEERQ